MKPKRKLHNMQNANADCSNAKWWNAERNKIKLNSEMQVQNAIETQQNAKCRNAKRNKTQMHKMQNAERKSKNAETRNSEQDSPKP